MEELVERAKKGNKEAFTTLMLSLEDELYKIAKIRLKNDDDIYDAIQETMVNAFQSIKKLKKSKYFKTWIVRILINKTNDIYRKNKINNEVQYENVEIIQPYNTFNTDNIDEILDFNFICKTLKYEDRIIILLYYMEGFTDKEIGKILKIKENTVKTKRIRAKQKIRDILRIGEK